MDLGRILFIGAIAFIGAWLGVKTFQWLLQRNTRKLIEDLKRRRSK